MKKEYYKDYFHHERNHWFFKARNKIITDHIREILKTKPAGETLKVLNVGVATGHTSVLLKEFGDVTSVEYDEDCYDFIKDTVPDIGLRLGTILDLDFEEKKFDLVCAFDVIEHVEEDSLAVSELKRVCKDGGNVVVTVPAFMSLWSHHDVINHHIKRYRKSEFQGLFNDDENIRYSSYFNFWLFPPVMVFRKLNNLLKITSSTAKDDEVSSDLTVMAKESFASNLIYKLFASESRRVKRFKSFPFGVSILTSWKKPA